jgi:putative aldouronate transport system substrate-binding protein
VISSLGLEGEHYTIVDGIATQNREQSDRFSSYGISYGLFSPYEEVIENPLPIKRPDNFSALLTERLDYADSCVMDPTIPYVSETQTRVGISELDPIRCDAINKYIIGAITKAQYQEAQQKWLASGGTQMTKEFNDQIKAASGR